MSSCFRDHRTAVSRIIILIASMLTFSSIALAEGATFYVAKWGDDSNSCEYSQYEGFARLSIDAGIACLSGGDTLIIGDGEYEEQINDTIPSGSYGVPTVIRAANRHGVVVRPHGLTWGFIGVFTIINRSNIVIDGIDADASYVEQPYYVLEGSANIVVQNGIARGGQGKWGSGVELRDAWGNQVLNMDIFYNGIGKGAHGIYVSGSYNLLQGNRVFYNSGYGIHVYGWGAAYNVIVGNLVFGNTWGSAYIEPYQGNEFFDNLLYDNGELELTGL